MLKNLVAVLFIWVSPTICFAKGTHILVLSFLNDSYSQATKTILSPRADGRYRMTNMGATELGGDCSSLLKSFQGRPLEAMRKRGYLSEESYKSLMEMESRGYASTQFTLITLFELVSLEEAKKLFTDPAELQKREMGTETDESGRELIKISTGTLFIVRGQIVDEKGEGRNRFLTKALPWETDRGRPAYLDRGFDRSKIGAIVELGRVHMEDGPLKGDFKLAARAAIALISLEHHALGIDSSSVLVTSRTRDQKTGRLNRMFFPLHPLGPELQKEIETDLPSVIAKKFELSDADKALTQDEDELVMVGSLADFESKYPLKEFSYLANQVEALSGGRINGYDAHVARNDFTNVIRDDFAFVLNGQTSSKPLFIRDFGTGVALYRSVKKAQAIGTVTPYDVTVNDDPIYELIFNNPKSDVDIFSKDWFEQKHYFNSSMQTGHYAPVMELANLDPEMAKNQPYEYVAAVILAANARVEQNIEAFSGETLRKILESANERRAELRLAPIHNFTTENFFETFPLIIASGDELIARQVQQLGGRGEKAFAASASMVSTKSSGSISFALSPIDGAYFRISPAMITNIKAQFPHLTQHAAQRLQNSIYKKKRLLQLVPNL